MRRLMPDADPEPEIYELLSWDLPGRSKHRKFSQPVSWVKGAASTAASKFLGF